MGLERQVLMKNGMTRDLSWDRSAEEYEQIFRYVLQAGPATLLNAAERWPCLHMQMGTHGPCSASGVNLRVSRWALLWNLEWCVSRRTNLASMKESAGTWAADKFCMTKAGEFWALPALPVSQFSEPGTSSQG